MHGDHEKPTQLQRKGDGEAWLFEKSLCVSVCVLWGGGVERETCLESRFCFRYLLNYSLGCHGNQQNDLNKSTQK